MIKTILILAIVLLPFEAQAQPIKFPYPQFRDASDYKATPAEIKRARAQIRSQRRTPAERNIAEVRSRQEAREDYRREMDYGYGLNRSRDLPTPWDLDRPMWMQRR